MYDAQGGYLVTCSVCGCDVLSDFASWYRGEDGKTHDICDSCADDLFSPHPGDSTETIGG